MVYPADYHMHTPLCHHASGEPAAYAAQAVKLGLKEIGFSDHSPMRADDFDNWRMRFDQLGGYVESVLQTRRAFPQLNIRLGLEVDYLPGHELWIQELASLYPWDYLIGSVHYVSGDWEVDNPARREEWTRRKPEEIWADYFKRLTQAAATRLFDIIGHADLPKKFGCQPPAQCQAMFEPFLQTASASQVTVELNTAGLRKDCREIYPSREILRSACVLGVPISFGSDAHAPEEVGMNFADAVGWARSAGYTHSSQFEQRRRCSVPLPA
jgi:histidinol-phosphatase (PHP family)